MFFIFITGHAGKADGFIENNGEVYIKVKSGRVMLVKERAFKCAIIL